ncbi:hypothetical protein HDU93_002726 [Gonapodya sp. JEL0774]|nr:hypothetical protein HDU93_002726 [Gonapodya sp. JEL0774]
MTNRPTNQNWHIGGRDLAVVVDFLRLRGTNAQFPGCALLGVGHSFGGYCVLDVEVFHPGTFDRIIAVEPVIASDEGTVREIEVRDKRRNATADQAAKRKDVFVSREAVFASWSSQSGFFGRWNKESLRAYVDDGIIPLDRTGTMLSKETEEQDIVKAVKWTLKTPKDQEAATFRGHQDFTDIVWRNLHTIRCPVTVVTGSETGQLKWLLPLESDPGKLVAKDLAVVDRLNNAKHVWVEGSDHMVVHEKPDAIAQLMQGELQRIITDIPVGTLANEEVARL